MIRALFARLRHVLTLQRGGEAPAPGRELPALLERFSQLEARVGELEQLNETAAEREMKWVEMNAQLRRFLGRLDAHAGRAKQEQENGGRLHARADVLAAKYPHGLPTKE